MLSLTLRFSLPMMVTTNLSMECCDDYAEIGISTIYYSLLSSLSISMHLDPGLAQVGCNSSSE